MIKISVITPVYNVPLQYLRICLDSLISQTLQECEFIIISDGASADECGICEEYKKKDSRFRFFKREHAGVSATRNFGLKQVSGEYISFVDADDWCDSNMLKECYGYAKERNSDVLTMDFYEEKNKNCLYRSQKVHTLTAINFIRQILRANIFGGMQPRIIRKDFYIKHPIVFSEDIGYCEDIIFWAQFMQCNPKIDYFNQAFYHYVQDNINSITRNYTIEKFKERQKFIKILKEILPYTFEREINVATLNVKMEAMSHKMLTANDFFSFERTTFKTLFHSSLPWITKIYLCFHSVLLIIFKKSYKEYL